MLWYGVADARTGGRSGFRVALSDTVFIALARDVGRVEIAVREGVGLCQSMDIEIGM